MKDQLLTTLENSRNYTLAVANAMPEKAYQFKPNGAGWNFQELMHHIAYGIEWWTENYLKQNTVEWNPPPTRQSKAEIIAYLDKNFTTLKDTVNQLPLNGKTDQGLNATLDHITHHRGQGVLYLRCNNIAPPEYTY